MTLERTEGLLYAKLVCSLIKMKEKNPFSSFLSFLGLLRFLQFILFRLIMYFKVHR